MDKSGAERIIQIIRGTGILPAIVFKSCSWIEPLGKIFKQTGFGVIEVLFRNDGAAEAVKGIKEKYPELVVGAGTVLTCDQADAAFEAGADFLISPGFSNALVRYCLEKNRLIIPGCGTASEIQNAYETGLRVLKFFPSERLGGASAIKDYAAPFKEVEFIPTGGIQIDNMDGYMKNDRVLAVGGSFMAPYGLLESEKYDEVVALYEKAAAAAVGFRVDNVGICCRSEDETADEVKRLSKLFGSFTAEKKISVCCGANVKYHYIGGYEEKSYISVRTYSIDRAITYLKARGVEFHCESEIYDAEGNRVCIRLKEEVDGYAVYIIK